MVKANEIVKYLDEYLEVEKVKDTGTNGLQVVGKDEVNKVALGVSTSVELFEKAAERGADMIIVHHGLFWEYDVRDPLTGRFNFSIGPVLKKRLKVLFDNQINLVAYHLPLDKHPKVGNNIQILKRLGLKFKGEFGAFEGQYIGVMGEMEPVDFGEFVKKVNHTFKTKSLVFNFGKKIVETVAIVSGGGSPGIKEAINKNVDVFLTGEPMEFIVNLSKDAKINVILPGHYATERFGVQALGKLLRKKFNLQTEFIEIPCKV